VTKLFCPPSAGTRRKGTASTHQRGPKRLEMKTLVLTFLMVFNGTLTDAFARSDSLGSGTLRGRYFLMVWGYQGPGNAPKDSHSFAAFYDGDDLADGRVINQLASCKWPHSFAWGGTRSEFFASGNSGFGVQKRQAGCLPGAVRNHLRSLSTSPGANTDFKIGKRGL